MIQVKVQGYLTLKQRVGKRQVSVPAGSCLADLLAVLQQDIGELFDEMTLSKSEGLNGRLVVMLNGMQSRHLPDGLNTPLKDGDQVAIFPPLVGGL